jgi:hypothetical protein
MSANQRDVIDLGLEIDPVAVDIAQSQGLRIEPHDRVGLGSSDCSNAPRRRIGTIAKRPIPRHNALSNKTLASSHIGKLDGLHPPGCGVNSDMRAPLRSSGSGAINHRCIDDPERYALAPAADAFVECRGQQFGQPSLRRAQPTKQARPCNLGDAHGTSPGRDILQRQVRNRIGQCQPQQRGRVWNLSSAYQRPCRQRPLRKLRRQQSQQVRPFLLDVHWRHGHAAKLRPIPPRCQTLF